MKAAPARLLPVNYPAYQAIFELNRAFEQVIAGLKTLSEFHFFGRDSLKANQVMVEEIRALANHGLLEILSDREFCNMVYYERLRLKWQNRFQDSSEVLFDAKHCKRRLGKRNPKQRQSSKPFTK